MKVTHFLPLADLTTSNGPQDFKVKMPEYFDDLMQALPFPQYTSRDGILNLAKYFPRQYVPPDLGPKMYNAFGRRAAWRGMDPKTPKGGHTNLHCDIADAVNVMLDVGIDDEDDSDDDEEEAAMYHDRELGDLRAAQGAIWDIYRWEDSDAILQLLHAVARERDFEITNNPIHDQASLLPCLCSVHGEGDLLHVHTSRHLALSGRI